MKNKKLKCIISLLLALVLLVSMPLNITAKAFAIETAWVTYALITFMAAMGITFTVSGGVQALENAVNNAWDECWGEEADTQRTHLCEIITFKAPSEPPSSGDGPPDPIETAYIFGSAACALIMKFVEWLKENKGWAEGEEVTYSEGFTVWPAVIDGVDTLARTSIVDNSTEEYVKVGSTGYYRYIISEYGTCIPLDWNNKAALTSDSYHSYSASTGYKQYFSINNSYARLITYYDTASGEKSSYKSVSSTLSAFGGDYSSDVVGITFAYSDYHPDLMYGVYDVNGYFYPMWYVMNADKTEISSDSTISVPDTITEFDIDETKTLEINFDVFTTEDNITSPETLGDAIKQTMNDSGTVPELSTLIETLPAPTPTPIVPLPETSPELEDIEDLGLPALGQALFSKFPFCIPNDLRNVFLILKAEPETPYWEVNLTGDALGIDSNFVIDFSEYEIVGQMSRWGSVISFCLFLIINTKRLIGW